MFDHAISPLQLVMGWVFEIIFSSMYIYPKKQPEKWAEDNLASVFFYISAPKFKPYLMIFKVKSSFSSNMGKNWGKWRILTLLKTYVRPIITPNPMFRVPDSPLTPAASLVFYKRKISKDFFFFEAEMIDIDARVR